MIKTYIKRVVSIVSILLITHIVLITTQVRYDHNNVGIEGYYMEEKDSIDFVLFGASEVYSDYSPALAYKLYGYTSYNYSIDNNLFVLYERQLDEIYRVQNPKLVMIEVATLIPDKEDMGVGEEFFDATLRKLTDSIPDLSVRYDLAKEFGDENAIDSYLYPPIKYHGKPGDHNVTFTTIDFHLRNYSYLKGYVSHTLCKPCHPENFRRTKGNNTKLELEPDYEKTLRSFLEHCKKKGYNVVFSRFPHRVEGKSHYFRFCYGNYVADVIREYGFDYIDFEQYVDKMGIDKVEDFYNESHLRACGARKMTEFMGQILTKKYGLTKTALSESNQNRWNESVKYTDALFRYFDELKNREEDTFLVEDWITLQELKKRM